jgi:competence protein ComEC
MSQDRSLSTFSPARQPFLYLTAALLAGILIDRWIAPCLLIVTAHAVLSILGAINLLLRKKDLAVTVALLISFTSAGALISRADRTGKAASSLVSLYDSKTIRADDPVEVAGVLVAPPEPAPIAYYLDVSVESIRVGDEIVTATGRVRLMVSLSGDEARMEFDDLALDSGARIRVLVRLERARSYSNPGSPDFNEFLERHGYDLKGVIKSPLLIQKIGDASHVLSLAYLYRLRLRLMSLLDARFNSRVSGTLKAMLTGNRYFLSGETVERLRAGSTFHTLVIAGLHIGIIAWALLGGRTITKRRRIGRVVLCLLVLWAYAVMVGLAPPVTRATLMITVGLIGPLLFRRSASINTVALSAFIMLALKPALVADPGFQLSFAAVAGIVALALPLLRKLQEIGQWRPNSRTPHPPTCSRAVRYFAETLFWNQRAFDDEMKRAPIRYQLKKAGAARVLGALRLQAVIRGAMLLMITSGAIQLSTLPLMALYFNRVSPVGVLLNVLAGLLTGVLMLSAVGAIGIGAISTVIAGWLVRVVNGAHAVLVNAIVPFVDIPFSTFRVAHYEGWHASIYALYFVPLAMMAVVVDRWRPVEVIMPATRIIPTERTKRTERTERTERTGRTGRTGRRQVASSRRSSVAPSLLCALAMAAGLIAVIKPAPDRPNGKLIVNFLDVGQGDSAFIVFPRGKTMLIDGGGEIRFNKGERNGGPGDWAEADTAESEFTDQSFSIGEAVVSRFIWSLGRTRVDYVLATHAHADHMGGLADVLRNLDVGQAVVGHAPTSDPEFEQFRKAAARRNVPVLVLKAGEHFDIDGVGIDVLWPPPAQGQPVTSGNDDSIVLRLVYGSISIMLAGDIERNAEDSLIAAGANLKADVLKVPHHGSRTSSTEAFVDAVNPGYAVISVGERSRFGHPHASVVERYKARGVKLLQTGREGMVTMETEGTSLSVRTFRR